MFGEFANDTNTLALWNFLGGAVTDQTGTYGGTLQGAPTAVSARFGTGYDLVPASSQYISTTFNPSTAIGNGNPYSIEFWVKLDSVASYKCLIGGDLAGTYWIVDINSTGKIRYLLSGQSLETANAVLATDKYHYIACTYDGNYMKIYLDGELIRTSAAVGSQNMNNAVIRLGARSDGNYMDGIFDSARFSNVARSYKEIKSYYNSLKQVI